MASSLTPRTWMMSLPVVFIECSLYCWGCALLWLSFGEFRVWGPLVSLRVGAVCAIMFNSAVTDVPEVVRVFLNKLQSPRSELLFLGLRDGRSSRKLHLAN